MKNDNLYVFGNVIQPREIPDFLRLVNLVKTATGQEIVNIEIMPGGLTNKNFKVVTGDDTSIAVRVAGPGTAKYINRPAEKHNASQMASLGIAPEIYYYDSKTGSQLVEFIDAATMHPEDFNTNPHVVTKAAEIMKKYHDSGMEFASTLNPISKIEEFIEILKAHSFDKRYDVWDRIADRIAKIEAAYKANPPKLVPCHNDTLAENFMYDGKVMRVIDWEYGGMNDPYFDMACVFVENPLKSEHEELFLKTYFGGELTEEQRARVLINKFLVNAHWSAWALVQIVNGKDHDFYWEYGRTRAVTCNENIDDPNFDRYIELIAVLDDAPAVEMGDIRAIR